MKALIQICLASLASSLLIASAAAQPAASGDAASATAAPATAAPATAAAAAPTAPTAPAASPPAAAPAADAASAAAAPAAPAAAGEPALYRMPVNGNPDATPVTLKDTCMAAINNDQQWTDELAAAIEKTVRFKVHNEEAELIALNKKHVVLAYAVLWLFSIGFLLAQWRRQQALKQQIESLKSDLAAAIAPSHQGPTA